MELGERRRKDTSLCGVVQVGVQAASPATKEKPVRS